MHNQQQQQQQRTHGRMVNGLTSALKNLNTYVGRETTRLRDSLSPSRQQSIGGTSTAITTASNGPAQTTAPSESPIEPRPYSRSSSQSGPSAQSTAAALPHFNSTVPTVPYSSLLSTSASVPPSSPSLPSMYQNQNHRGSVDRSTGGVGSVEDPIMPQGNRGMSRSEFRKYGKETVDYIADYLETIHKRRDLIPSEAPQRPESWETVIDDFERLIMPGVTHWQHPRFHAYFPAGNSFPSILADMISDALGCAACPAMTELELIMLDWFGKMIGLPKEFLPLTEGSKGGGVIQSSASECNFVSLLAARFEVMKELLQIFPFVEEGLLLSKLIAYCSKEAHSSVEKACMIGMVKLRILETDSRFRLRGDTLRNAIQEDRNLGLIPFFVSTTLGTTSCCSFDVLSEIGPVCQQNELWLHVDAAYAGSSFICPEFRYLMSGIEYAMSFNTNPNKFLLVNFDCSTMWVKDRFKLTQALVVDPLYLQHSWMDKSIDYRHWGIPLSRRFRSLKLWFVIRMYGVEGLQSYIREHCRLAKKMEALLAADSKFEICNDVFLGLVCFRMRGSDDLNQQLLTRLNSSGRLHMVPASLNDRFVIRFCVCAENAMDDDILHAYDIINQFAQHILHENAKEPIAEEDEMLAEDEAQFEYSVHRKTSEDTSSHLERALSKEELLAHKQQQSIAQKRYYEKADKMPTPGRPRLHSAPPGGCTLSPSTLSSPLPPFPFLLRRSVSPLANPQLPSVIHTPLGRPVVPRLRPPLFVNSNSSTASPTKFVLNSPKLFC
ncbi:hypothetical protein WR25_01734 [Diploscapter pachys]|uniref:Aromatic-L-amino-acid decarboxylase n=1 Tax=Diploscapter pachys TaxID=2018661 RepID=A0A2A2LRI1_9BILA|nr:hypothetical protein WR25_01734 [Diploscapter pachys]